MIMKRFCRALLASGLISVFIALPSYAEEIYKRVDDNGVPSFSDTESKDAEKIVVEAVKIQSVPTAAPSHTTTNNSQPSVNYSKLSIIKPTDQATLHNDDKILLQIAIEPGLRQGHLIEFLDNGLPLQAAARSSSMMLMNFDRGTHTLTAHIIDETSKVLKTSNPVTVHIFRTIAPPPAPPTTAPAP